MKFFEQGRDLHFSLGYRNSSRPDELHDPEGFKFVVHLVDLMAPPGLCKHKEFPAHCYDLAVALLDDILDLAFIKQQVGGNFEKGGFLVDRLLIGVVKRFDHFNLLFDLGDNPADPRLGRVDDNGEF